MKSTDENVVDILAAELHRINNESPRLPTQESIKSILNAHLKPYLEDNKNVLCPRVWSNFYEFWKDVNPTEGYDILPIWMTSEHMMRRYPKFFLNSTMMTGPASVVARKDGGLTAIAAMMDTFASYEVQLKPHEFGTILEDIQDTRAINRIVGIKFTRLMNATCDHLAGRWNKVINDGGMIYPYTPLIMDSEQKNFWSGKIFFRSRYGVMLKEQYNP